MSKSRCRSEDAREYRYRWQECCTVAYRDQNIPANHAGNSRKVKWTAVSSPGSCCGLKSAVIDGQYIHPEAFESFSDIVCYIFLLLS